MWRRTRPSSNLRSPQYGGPGEPTRCPIASTTCCAACLRPASTIRWTSSSLRRQDIALAKANGALGMGLGSRTLAARAKVAPAFIGALSQVMQGGLAPAAGGVLVRDAGGELLGAVGVSGDVSDNDEAAALAGIAAVGLVGDPGED